jgi:hypothetical protein
VGAREHDPTDIADVTSATHIYLINGNSAYANWTGLFSPGERVRLRFTNGSAMTIFDVRIPGLSMTVVAGRTTSSLRSGSLSLLQSSGYIKGCNLVLARARRIIVAAFQGPIPNLR